MNENDERKIILENLNRLLDEVNQNPLTAVELENASFPPQ